MKLNFFKVAAITAAFSLAGVNVAHGAVPNSVSSSTHDGNVPANTLDGDLNTRWSANGNGEWITYDFGQSTALSAIELAFFKGDQRTADFRVEKSDDNNNWDELLVGQSSGASTALETFAFSDNVSARYFRIVGLGNSANTWNSITEAEFVDADDQPILDKSVTASAHDGNVPENVIDNDLNTRWSANGSGQWISLDLGSTQSIQAIDLAFFKGNTRKAYFSVEVSTNGSSWSSVISNATSTGATLESERFVLSANQNARYIRYTGNGNSVNSWNSLTEFDVCTAGENCGAIQKPLPGCDGVMLDGTCTDWLNVFDAEGANPISGSTMAFDALEERHVTPNGNGWRHELKIKSAQRVAMTEVYEDFSANVKCDLSDGSKTIVAQHHASDTGTIMKLYVSDSSESGFDDSEANNGIFDVYVRLAKEDGSGEEKKALGTIRSGDNFDFRVINDHGYVTVSAMGQSFSLRIEDSSASYLKFGNYLQAQDAETLEKVESSDDFEAFYQDAGITTSLITMTNLSYERNLK